LPSATEIIDICVTFVAIASITANAQLDAANLSKIFHHFIHDNATAYICLCTCSENYLLVDTFDYRLLLLISLHYFNVQSAALFVTVFGLPDTV